MLMMINFFVCLFVYCSVLHIHICFCRDKFNLLLLLYCSLCLSLQKKRRKNICIKQRNSIYHSDYPSGACLHMHSYLSLSVLAFGNHPMYPMMEEEGSFFRVLKSWVWNFCYCCLAVSFWVIALLL